LGGWTNASGAQHSKEIEAPALIDDLLKLLDGPKQREAERLAREALGAREPGNIAWQLATDEGRSISATWSYVAAVRTPVGCARSIRTGLVAVMVSAAAAPVRRARTAMRRMMASGLPSRGSLLRIDRDKVPIH
jgi:hypothetical protein